MIRRSSGFLTQLYVMADLVVIQIVFLIAWWIKFESGWLKFASPLPVQHYFGWSLVYSGFVIVIGFSLGLYTPKRRKNFSYEFARVIQIHITGLLGLLSVLFVFKVVDISRDFLVIYLIGHVTLISGYRWIVKENLKRIRERGYNKHFVLILGAGSLGRRFYKNLLAYPELGYEVIGFLDDFHQEHPAECKQYKPILGGIDQLAEILTAHLVDEVIIALPLHAHEKLGAIIEICEKTGMKTYIIPDYFDYLPARPYFDNFAGIPLINVRDIPLDELRNRMMKRAFDIVFSLTLIIATLPLLLVISAGIAWSSSGPVIFKQERIGWNRRTFNMYKFRTMRVQHTVDSDTLWTVESDPRRTRFGALLRKTSLDELPQFFNVLLGHMSVVGPRPERPYFVEQFKEGIPKYMIKHHIRPGITGWAQTNGYRGDTSIKERIRHDLFYIENWTFLFDMKIIYKTIVNGLIDRNAY